jgi:hypothetical protein
MCRSALHITAHCFNVSRSPQLHHTPLHTTTHHSNTQLLPSTLLSSHYTHLALNFTFHLHFGLPTELFPSDLRPKWSLSFQTPVISFLFSLIFSYVLWMTEHSSVSEWQKCASTENIQLREMFSLITRNKSVWINWHWNARRLLYSCSLQYLSFISTVLPTLYANQQRYISAHTKHQWILRQNTPIFCGHLVTGL